MKKLILLLVVILFSIDGKSQIGVNTENPKSLLHIDGASSPATTNPATGSVTSAQAVDDVVIDNSGNIGIGKLSPTTKVDIETSTAGGAIRIVDGTQARNRVLVSNASGIGSWGAVAGTWYAALYSAPTLNNTTVLGVRQVVNFSDSIISSSEGSVNKTAGSITVPVTGRYRVILSMHWLGNRVAIGSIYRWGGLLYKNGVDTGWNPSGVGVGGHGIFPTVMTIMNLNANDVLTLYTDERYSDSSNSTTCFIFMAEYLQ